MYTNWSVFLRQLSGWWFGTYCGEVLNGRGGRVIFGSLLIVHLCCCEKRGGGGGGGALGRENISPI